MEWEEGSWQCGLGFTIPDNEDEYLYGTINWLVNKDFKIENLDWNID